MKRSPIALAGMILVAIGGCGIVAPAAAPIAGPADPDAEMRPDLIVAEPPRVAAGGVLALTFPEETSRGIHFVLENEARGAWFHAFDLTSDGGPAEGWEPAWRPAGDEDFAIPDIGIVGPGPDRVLIPDIAPPGAWRICSGNAGENFCTEIEILDP